MVERCGLRRRLEPVPGAGVDLARDAFEIDELLGLDQRRRFESEVVDVIVPPRMFAEGSEKHPRPGERRARAVVFVEEISESGGVHEKAGFPAAKARAGSPMATGRFRAVACRTGAIGKDNGPA